MTSRRARHSSAWPFRTITRPFARGSSTQSGPSGESLVSAPRPMPSSWPHVDKSAPARELFTAIRRVAAGQSWLPPAIPELLAVARASIHAEDRAIFDLLVTRTPPAQIAASLRLSRPQLET